MPNYMIGDDVLVTNGMEQSEEASNSVRTSISTMLELSKRINLGDDIRDKINKLRDQYNAKDAKKVVDGLHNFDARLFFEIMDIISIKVAEFSQVYQNKLFADYIVPTQMDSDHESEPNSAEEEVADNKPLFDGYVGQTAEPEYDTEEVADPDELGPNLIQDSSEDE